MTLPEPYYDRDGITIYCADCRDVLPHLPPVDLVLTDPPYSPECHAGARAERSLDSSLIDFAPIDGPEWVEWVSPLVKRWIISSMDWRHIATLSASPPDGLRFVRFGIWIKENTTPQFSGDRPGPGWEGIAFLHREGGRMQWNGGGRSSVFSANPKVGNDSDHPTSKPIKLIREWVSLFSNPFETILDPFMGSGTTLRAAMDLGRKAIGIEIEERYCEIAVKRLQQSVMRLEIPA